MRWKREKCPECGAEPSGIVEIVHCEAKLQREKDGSYQYGGETDIWWDDQQPVRKRGCDVLVCESGHEWLTHRKDIVPD